MLEHAGTYAHRLPEIPPDRGAEWAARLDWQASTGVDFSTPTAPARSAVEVYANHGRWVVECPDCHGAQLACDTDARFMCHCCANAAIGGRWRPVVWPRNRRQIERVLLARPFVENRNWLVGETVADLEAENAAHLVGVI